MAEMFASRTRDEWCAVLEGSDACFAPVLSPEEAARHPHNAARANYVELDGVLQAAPAPRFSATPSGPVGPVPRVGEGGRDVLYKAGISAEEVGRLQERGVIRLT